MSSSINGYYYCDFIKEFHNHRLKNKDKLIPLLEKLSNIIITSNNRVVIKHTKDVYSIQYTEYALDSFRQFWCFIKGIKYTLKDLFIKYQAQFIGILPEDYKNHDVQADYDIMSKEEISLKSNLGTKEEWNEYLSDILLNGGYSLEAITKGNNKVTTSYKITKL